MKLISMIAKAGVLREDGKLFTAEILRMHAKESPEMYIYLEGPQELWSIKKRKENANVN